MEKKKRGRPSKPIENHKRFKSISVPEELYYELESQAKAMGITVGKVASNRIQNGYYDDQDDGLGTKTEASRPDWIKSSEDEDSDTEDFV